MRLRRAGRQSHPRSPINGRIRRGERLSCCFLLRLFSLSPPHHPALPQTAQACQALASDISVDKLPCDLTDPSQIDSLHAAVASKGCAVDILVANAGAILGGADPLTGDPDGWDAMASLNLMAPMRLTRLWAPEMASRGFGALIFTGSLAGVQPTKNAAYCASKHAVRSWALSCYEVSRLSDVCAVRFSVIAK